MIKLKNKYIQIRIDEEEKKRIKEFAVSTGRSVAGFLLWLARQEMEGK